MMGSTGTYLEDYALLLTAQGQRPGAAFAALLEEFNGTPFAPGGRGMDGSTGAGAICACLSALLGRRVCATAQALLARYFTAAPQTGDAAALFLLDGAGTPAHVAGYLGGGLYLNLSPDEPHGATPRTAAQMLLRYPQYRPALRALRHDLYPCAAPGIPVPGTGAPRQPPRNPPDAGAHHAA